MFTKQQREIGMHITSAYLRERELYDGQFLKFLSSILKASYMFCLGYFRDLDKLNEFNFSRDS